MKYAVFEHGGKQFVASEGQLVEIDRLAQQAGAAVEFSQVLLLREDDRVEIGSPYVRGARVMARIAEHVKGPKLQVFKYRPKQRYRVRQGHRQGLTKIEIESIGMPSAAAAKKAEARAEPKPQAAPSKRAAAAKPTTSRAKPARKTSEPAAKASPKRKPKPSKPKAGAKPSKAAKKPAAKKKPKE